MKELRATHIDLTELTALDCGKTTRASVNRLTGWVFVQDEHGALWLKTPARPQWEKLRNGPQKIIED